MTNFWIAAVLLLSTIDEVPPALKGRLCIGDPKSMLSAGQCTDTTGTALLITPADRERLFVWTSADSATVHLGTIAPKAALVDLDRASTSTMQLSVEGDRPRGWPADVTVTVAAKEQWRWIVDAKQAPRLRNIVVPRGKYMLLLKADRHRSAQRAGINATTETIAVGEVRLPPVPIVRGVVVDAEDKPLASAIVSLPDASLCTTANEQGAFACELREPVPEVIVVSSAGHGERELTLDAKAGNDINLGRIVLASGRKLTLKIVRPEAATGKVTLYLDSPERHEHSKLKTASLAEREEEVRFDAAAGTYLVVIEGEKPLERLEVPVTIGDEDVEREIAVRPYQLLGTVKFGDDPVAEGSLEMVAPGNTWRVALPVTNGAFNAALWQPGKLSAFLGNGELGVELVHSPELGEDPSRWDIRIEKRMIVGRVLDAETRKPVPDVKLEVTARFAVGSGHFRAKVDRDGAYQILANKVGSYGLRVSSAEHVPYTHEVQVTAEDKIRTVDVLLERGVVQPLDIVNAAGAPIANALILEGVQPDRVNTQFRNQADGRGRYELRGRPGETRLLYVVPQEGSVAVARVRIPRTAAEAKPLPVVVPAPTSTLRVRTVDREGKPVPAVILMRYNGEFLPMAIVRFMTGEFPGTAPAGEGVVARLPAGAYELWALNRPREEEEAMILSGGSLRQPARVGLSGGEGTVTVVAPAP